MRTAAQALVSGSIQFELRILYCWQCDKKVRVYVPSKALTMKSTMCSDCLSEHFTREQSGSEELPRP